MCFNAGKLDRALRGAGGLVLLGYAVFGFENVNYIIAGISLIPLGTAIFGFCPFYPILGLNTGCKNNKVQ